ncbi:peptide transporter PTR2-A [Nannizzia gypsea CBS 118893]|uniref:Peptide transporter PTR2-A n=1 Tax=Arthroderma gypseum (strain ATCC MYA-4604 / CBS 118893) TaxID=535722 RepID=E4UY47_ARTGP|nr:peptide transporter PTR2-A [Nannizzia gypsea CBS 118893]EFR02827.1 peptide transporter PTR2-A [Nannizzia gypsea CBS 118893]
MDTSPAQNEKREATEDEIVNLEHVVDSVPGVVWVALVAAAAERFTFYAATTPWQNYIQNGSDSIAVPGALGLGQATATNISNAFFFFSFLSPMPFAILSDAWLGRYKTLCLSFSLNICGCLALFVTSLPSVTKGSIKIAGLAISMVFLGLGTGGVRATVSPFIGDQYTVLKPQLIVTKSGKKIVTDRTLTLQYIYNVLYWFTNIASLSLIASTYLEKEIGFWAAYLLPLCTVWMLIPLMLFWQKKFVKLSPQGNALPQAAKVIACAIRGRFRLDVAKPSFQASTYGREVEWNDQFVTEMKKGLIACKVMACFVPFYLCTSQLTNNLISQAGQTRLGGIPNDTIQALNSIACVLLGPILQKILYPTLQRHGIAFRPIARMTSAFVIISAAMAFTAGLQKLIYMRGPCYGQPLSCPDSNNGSIPNDISVWAQTPIYFLLAGGEILGFATLSEYSYSKSPQDMRSLVQALRQVTAGIGSALGIATSPLAVNPRILYLYTGLAAVMIITAPIFWMVFRDYDKIDEELNCIESAQPANNDRAEDSISDARP